MRDNSVEFIFNKQNQILLLAGYTEGVWQIKSTLVFPQCVFSIFYNVREL